MNNEDENCLLVERIASSGIVGYRSDQNGDIQDKENWWIENDEESGEEQYYNYYENDQLVYTKQVFVEEEGKERVLMGKTWKNCSVVIQSTQEDIGLTKRITSVFDMVLVMRLVNQMESVVAFVGGMRRESRLISDLYLQQLMEKRRKRRKRRG